MERMINKRNAKIILWIVIICLGVLLISTCQVDAVAKKTFANVCVSAWKSMLSQLKTIVNTILFPALDAILAVAFFFKCGCAYFDYRKQQVIEWTAPAILAICLVLSLLGPSFVWDMAGV